MSIANDSQFKKTRSAKLKMLGCLCNQTLNLETDAKTLYYMYSLLKLKYSTSVYIFKAQKRLQKLICIFKHPTATNRIFYQKIFKSIDRSIGIPSHLIHEKKNWPGISTSLNILTVNDLPQGILLESMSILSVLTCIDRCFVLVWPRIWNFRLW